MKSFIVKFKGGEIDGYYADKQPNYHWSFTNDIALARIYKTKQGAQRLIDHQNICSYRYLKSEIVSVSVETIINII